MEPQLSWYLALSAILFTIGVTGVIIKRNVIAMFMCIELMLNAVNLTFVAFASFFQDVTGQLFVFIVMTVAAAEAAVGLGNGMVLGVIAALVAWVWRGNATLGVVLGAAMIINMFVAATAGTLVPLGLRAANVDPALASSVFITTLTDIAGFFAYLGLATIFIQHLAGL